MRGLIALKSICKFNRFGVAKLSNGSLIRNFSQNAGGGDVTFKFHEESTGNMVEVTAPLGKTLLDVALENNVDIEGACGGELACSTCHVVCSEDLFYRLPAKKEEEDDMLDLAWGLTDTSRLCCQLKVTKDIEGETFKVPSETNNML